MKLNISDDGSNDKSKVNKSKSTGAFPEIDSKKSSRKAEKEKKRQEKERKEEDKRNRKAMKESGGSSSSRNRSRSKTGNNNGAPNNFASAFDQFAQPNGKLVPLFIEKCTQFIEQEGLDMEGIYRVPGNRAHVDTLLQQFDESKFDSAIILMSLRLTCLHSQIQTSTSSSWTSR